VKKHTILFLAANPTGTSQLALDREARAIHVELERAGFRDSFELVTRWAAEPLDLLRELRKLKPTVVHFSGHGQADGARRSSGRGDTGARDLVTEADPRAHELTHSLCFQGPDGQPQLVSTAALQQTFGAAGSSVRLVVLNACYSETQAAALLTHVDCVVGMRGAIHDDAARAFAIGFYGGLGERESVAAAYHQGCAAISLEGGAHGDRPQLEVRSGVDAARLFLAEASAPVAGPASSAGRMTSNELLTRLSDLLPSQFEEVLYRAQIPMRFLPGATASQTERAIGVMRYVEQQNQLEQLARIVQQVAGGGRAGPGPR
jgi:hypothetical protein